MRHSRQPLSRVIGYHQGFLTDRSKRVLGICTVALPVSWIALGVADHSQLNILTWIVSPGLPIVLHFFLFLFDISFSGWLTGLTIAAFTALLIDFVYYSLLIHAVVLCVRRIRRSSS
jgi:hypothetical protein